MKQAIIVGAGHAGLATAYLLRQKGYHKVVILEASNVVGSAWRNRYEGLTLFTSRRYSQLPGLNISGNASEYPSKQEFVEYLEQYAAALSLDIRFGRKVVDVRNDTDGFTVNCSNGENYHSKMLFVCTGAFQIPHKHQLDSNSFYHGKVFTPESIGDRHLTCENENWLVIGDGASGRHLAKMLVKKNQVFLSMGKARSFLPQRLLGKDIFFWLDKLGLTRLGKQHWLAKKMRKKDPFPATGSRNYQLAKAGITLCKRFNLNKLNSEKPITLKGQVIDKVIIATGYNNDFSWLESCLAQQASNKDFFDKVSDISGLYILSQPWLSSRGSGLIMGIEHDFKLLDLLEC